MVVFLITMSRFISMGDYRILYFFFCLWRVALLLMVRFLWNENAFLFFRLQNLKVKQRNCEHRVRHLKCYITKHSFECFSKWYHVYKLFDINDITNCKQFRILNMWKIETDCTAYEFCQYEWENKLWHALQSKQTVYFIYHNWCSNLLQALTFPTIRLHSVFSSAVLLHPRIHTSWSLSFPLLMSL